MNKLLSSVGVALAVAMVSLLTGCQLYFGTNDSGSRPGSGGVSGGSGGRPGGGNEPGFGCSSDAQCAAGCFCADGVCAEGGFCSADKDCGDGFHCDTGRASCIPNATCAKDDQCPAGSMCDAATGSGCVVTCACTSDADATKKGFGWCDETRSTCMTGKDPAGACNDAVTCATAAPGCPEGQVALVKDGCFTGACRAITSCEAAPSCTALQHQDDCEARTDCGEAFTGHNCTGTGCGTPGGDCTCESYTFAGCSADAIPVTVIPES